MEQPTIVESRVICKQVGRYIGWPTVARAASGELLVVFSGDRDLHVCPFGKTFLMRSADDGETWSPPELVNDTPLDDRDAGVCALPDGTAVVSWFTSHYEREVYMRRAPAGEEPRWRAQLDRVRAEDIRAWAGESVEAGRYELGQWVRRSTDNGRTWEAPRRSPCNTPHGPIALSDGRLLYLGADAANRSRRERALVCAVSQDGGRTWEVLSRLSAFPPYPGGAPDGMAYFCEPHVVEVEPGRLTGMTRYEEVPRAPERCVLWQFDSDDGGRTWTEPRSTGILGKPPHLARLRDGRLLLTYGYRHPPYGQRACLSRDGGRTWDYEHELVLRDDAPNGDLGYPASIECEDGSILTVYYQLDRPGEKTCLMTTRWKPPR